MAEPTARFRNVSGQKLTIAALGRDVDDDAVFDVPVEDAVGFACQPTNYQAVDDAAEGAVLAYEESQREPEPEEQPEPSEPDVDDAKKESN